MKIRLRIVLCISFSLILHLVQSQQQPNAPNTPGGGQDTTREVHLIRSDILKFEKKDSTELQILVGNAMLNQKNTFFNGDSIVMNKSLNVIEAFGNIHINDADSVNVYSQYLIYYGNTRIAHLKKNVKLTDGKATLTSEDLEYDLNTKTGTYLTGGKIVTASSTLTSGKGYYYADTRDAYFIQKVKLVDPDYTVATDTLLYNMDTQIASFVSPTTINDGKSIIRTSDGYYDMKNGFASFGKRPIVEDSSQYITANYLNFDRNTGIGHAEGNVIYIDTAQGVTLSSERSDFNRDNKTVLATLKPVMIIRQDNDSIFVSADTLYSGIMTDTLFAADSSGPGQADSLQVAAVPEKDSLAKEFGKDLSVRELKKVIHKKEQNAVPEIIPKEATRDSMATGNPEDAVHKETPFPVSPGDSITGQAGINSDTSHIQDNMVQEIRPAPEDTIASIRIDTVEALQSRAIERVDSVRFFEAYHRVRIFSDSMQAVCDSLFFSGKDSVFRLFTNPVLWAKDSQITGDTIYLYTKNKKPDHVTVIDNAFSISRSNDSFYNQLKGNTINGFFKDGDIEHIVAKGSAESLYYLQDDDSAYTGANYAQADLINLYFIKKELDKISWIYEVKGGFYPVNQVPEERRRFRNFKWEADRRPKSRLELYE